VSSGGATSGTQVGALGTETVSALGTASGTNVTLGGAQRVFSGGDASGSVVSDGGYIEVLSGGTLASAGIVGGGTVMLSAGAVDTTSIAFVSSGGTVYWGGSGTLSATLAGFGLGDAVDLTALSFIASGTASFGTMLTVTEGGHSDQLRFAAGFNLAGEKFLLTSDGQGGTLATLVPNTGAGTVQTLLAGNDARF
jgi:autotransporter passenger strand-loop-strand repeat protein